MSWSEANLEINREEQTAILYDDDGTQMQPKGKVVSYMPAQTSPLGNRAAHGHLFLQVPAHENVLGDLKSPMFQVWMTYDDPESCWRLDKVDLRKCELLEELEYEK